MTATQDFDPGAHSDSGTPPVRRVRIAGLTALALAFVLGTAHYNRYVYAVAWHCAHGNYAQVAGHNVRLPILWWAEKDPDYYDTYLLLRACPFSTRVRPSLTVRPTLQGAARETDAEELEAVQALIALKDSKSTAGISSSLVTLHSKQFTLYWERLEFAPFGTPINTSLYCAAAKSSYFWNYFGPLFYEKEAELILSTLQ